MKKLSFFLLLAVCVILFAVRGARNWFASSSYGQQHIILADGTKLYVVRELWRSRERLYITRSSDGCKTADRRTDYIGPVNAWSILLYKIQPDGWNIYSDISPRGVAAPTQEWNRSKPVLVVAKNPGIEDLYLDRKRYGISVINVPPNEICLINLFRIENSLQ